MTDLLTITVSKTANGLKDYVQVMSGDAVSVNVVLIADRIKIIDSRSAPNDVPHDAGVTDRDSS